MANSPATFNIGENTFDYSKSDNLGTYSGVNLWLSDDAADQLTKQEVDELEAGGTFTKQQDEDGNDIVLGYKSDPWSNTGRVLDIVNPFGTVRMASDILEALRQSNGIALNYSPFETGAIIPPHFEIGDAALINNNHHGIYGFKTEASRLARSQINAPADEEIDHEYPFKNDVKSRALTRKFESVQSQFIVQAGKINAKVSRVGENESHTFGWSLTENGFFINNGEVRADGTDLFTFNSSGLHIKGDIEATSGHIGGDNGFVIESGKLYSGKTTYNSTASGVYIGTDGISLGSRFKVDTSGNVTGSHASFDSISITNSTFTGSGSFSGYGSFSGGSLGGGMSFGGSRTVSGVNTSIGSLENRVETIYADYINTNNLYSKIAQLASLSAQNIVTNGLTCNGTIRISDYISMWGYNWSPRSATIDGVTIYYLGR